MRGWERSPALVASLDSHEREGVQQWAPCVDVIDGMSGPARMPASDHPPAMQQGGTASACACLGGAVSPALIS